MLTLLTMGKPALCCREQVPGLKEGRGRRRSEQTALSSFHAHLPHIDRAQAAWEATWRNEGTAEHASFHATILEKGSDG